MKIWLLILAIIGIWTGLIFVNNLFYSKDKRRKEFREKIVDKFGAEKSKPKKSST